MFASRIPAICVFALAALAAAEPVLAPAPQVVTCPQVTATVTAKCTGIYNCPIKKECTETAYTNKPCGGPGPVCTPGPKPTVTSTVDKGCTKPCGGTCAHTATVTTCSFFKNS